MDTPMQFAGVAAACAVCIPGGPTVDTRHPESASCALLPQVHGPQQEIERLRDELVRAHSINGRLQLQVIARHQHKTCVSLVLPALLSSLYVLVKLWQRNRCWSVMHDRAAQVQTLSREVLRLQRAAGSG